MGEEKHSHFWKYDGGGSFDMCFCRGDCARTDCKRNMRGKHFKDWQEWAKGKSWARYSCADFPLTCKEYKGGKK